MYVLWVNVLEVEKYLKFNGNYYNWNRYLVNFINDKFILVVVLRVKFWFKV